MARKVKPSKPLIYVFCEGESEQCYARFLKEHFEDVAVIKPASKLGLFDEADSCFEKSPKYKSSAEVTDEIWFFFDVEETDHGHWDSRYKIIKKLRKLRKKPNIRIRLLMTTGCIEYWLMLHYQMMAPNLTTKPEKERMEEMVRQRMPGYAKGDWDTTSRIAQRYPEAVKNGKKTLNNLLADGLPGLDDTDERNRWLHQSSRTFTTVQEAIVFLEQLAG
ncbi:MAG: RloB domain-containing protein [Oscillospiraceae bacterium]|nr:RloB domain-containing protein [Oscillospiraceae bacterium]